MTANLDRPRVGRSYIRTWRAILVLFIVGLLASSYSYIGLKGHTISAQYWDASLSRILGGGTGLTILPAIVIIIWRWIQRRRVTNNNPIIFGVVIFAIITLMNLHAVSFERKTERLFSPIGCEYEVKFAEKPRLYVVQKESLDGKLRPLHGADLTVSSGRGFTRAECVEMGLMDQSQFLDQNILLWSSQIAKDLGILRPNFKVTRGPLGTVATVIGFKSLGRGQMTVEVTNYIGSKSILTTYRMSLSKDFATAEMTQFSNSVRRKP